MIKKISLAVLLFAIGLTWFIWYGNVDEAGTFKSVDFIASHINGRGEIVDFQNDLGVTSVEDIRWYDEEEHIEIEFGKVRMKFKKKNFTTEEVLNALNRIHITVKQNNDTGEYNLYYKGEKVDLYVK